MVNSSNYEFILHKVLWNYKYYPFRIFIELAFYDLAKLFMLKTLFSVVDWGEKNLSKLILCSFTITIWIIWSVLVI